MFFDFRQLEAEKKIETDICIIGAGAAGITLARRFIGSRIQVCLLESGGFEFDNAIQSLYEGKNIGLPCGDLRAARLRYFGGTTNHWAGWCAPFNEIDFEARSWVPYSGWPIRKKELEPYYEAAHTICELGPYRYDTATWSDETRRFPSFESTKLITQFWQFSNPPTRFGTAYRDELEKAQNIHVYLYANITELEANETASEVRAVQIRTLSGKAGSVQAKYFILACGAIENARLLLLSNRAESKGLGNQYDLVGRFFMDHPTVQSAQVLANDPDMLGLLFHKYRKAGQQVLACLCPTAEAQKQKKILNYSATLERPANPDDGYTALYQFERAYRKSRWPDEFGNKLWTVITDLDSVAKYLYDRVQGEVNLPRTGTMLTLTTRTEQAPNPDSRIVLSNERDELGLNKVQLAWRLSELDQQTIRAATQLIGEEFGRLGLGRVKLADWLVEMNDTSWPESLHWGWHHMGTTRMADNPKQGVVDHNCRVHSITNLYIAGSSIFTTSSYANPTLTIVAFALRLADHLKTHPYT